MAPAPQAWPGSSPEAGLWMWPAAEAVGFLQVLQIFSLDDNDP